MSKKDTGEDVQASCVSPSTSGAVQLDIWPSRLRQLRLHEPTDRGGVDQGSDCL